MLHKKSGFTIVELLIVIVIIAILASITIIAFNGTQQRAIQASLQADTDKARKKILLYHAENSTYPTAINCTNSTATEVCVQPSGTNVYTYSSNNTTNPATFYLNTSNGKYAYQASNTSGTEQAQTIVTDGLVLHLDAGNPASYPGTGTTWYDLSGSGYEFTSSNPPLFIADNNGNKAFEFTGAGKYFDSTTVSPFSGNQFSISVIAVIDQFTTGSYYGILTQNEQAVYNSMAFLSYNGKFGTDHWSPGGSILTTSANNNQKYFVAWTIPKWQDHQTGSTKIYLNANEQATQPYSVDTVGSLAQKKFRVGNWQLDRADMNFQGRIYEIQVYNRALTSSEITQNFNALRGRYGI